jgi:hypothetical protein
MISTAETPQSPQPEIFGRLAVFEYDGDQKNLIARLMVTVDEGQGNIRIDGPTDDGVKRIGSIIERLGRETTDRPTLDSLRNQPWPEPNGEAWSKPCRRRGLGRRKCQPTTMKSKLKSICRQAA